MLLHTVEGKSAPQLITTLIKDVKVYCMEGKNGLKKLQMHECSTSPIKGEVKVASQLLCRFADTSPEKCITVSIY